MAKITRAKRFRTTIKKLISRHKRRARRRNSSHRGCYMLLAASLLALGANLLPDAVFAEKTVWSFEEVLAARDKYESQVVAQCDEMGSCELNAYQELAKNGEPDAKAAGMLAANGLLITYIHPETGVIKLFYNNRASLLTRVNGQAKPVLIAEVTWTFTNSEQTYKFTDASQIIPQQEITLTPEGIDFSSGVTVDNISAKLSLEGGSSVSRTLGPQKCIEDSNYAPGKECRLVADAKLGFTLRPIGEATVVPPTPDREDDDTPPVIFPSTPDHMGQGMGGYESDYGSEMTPQTPQLPQTPIVPDSNHEPNHDSTHDSNANSNTDSSDSLLAGATHTNSNNPTDGNLENTNASTKIPLAPNTAVAPAHFDHKQLLIHFSLALALFNFFALALRHCLRAH